MQTPRWRRDVPRLGADRVRERVRPARSTRGPTVRMSKSVMLTIDRIKCDGGGLCAELLPELIRLDEWGYPILTSETVPDHLQPLARRAVDDCPVLALALRRAEHKQ